MSEPMIPQEAFTWGQVAARGALVGMEIALEESSTLRGQLLELHRPKGTSTGTKCTTCAVWDGRGAHLKRAPWPCETAKLMGVDS